MRNFIIDKALVIRKKADSQNGAIKKTKPDRFSVKWTFLIPWYSHVRVRIRGVRNFSFLRNLAALFSCYLCFEIRLITIIKYSPLSINKNSECFSFHQVNPFVPNVPFLYPLKRFFVPPEKVFWCIQGIEKGFTGNKWVNVVTSPTLTEYEELLIATNKK